MHVIKSMPQTYTALAAVYTAKQGIKRRKARGVTPNLWVKLIKNEKPTGQQKHQCTPLIIGV
jgi:hypothetical protein